MIFELHIQVFKFALRYSFLYFTEETKKIHFLRKLDKQAPKAEIRANFQVP